MRDKVILITGASSGIGAALAEKLASKYSGVSLVLASRNQEKLATVAEKCRQLKATVLVVPTDLTQIAQVKALAETAIAYYGTVDVLVNNAGYGQMGPVELIPLEAAREQFEVNFYAPLVLTQALIPKMREQGGGRIINVSSLGGRIPFPTAGMYSCSKFALEAFSDVLRMELKAFNIQVSVIEPGPVITKFFQVAQEQIEQTMPHYQDTLYAPIFENIEAVDRQLDILGWSAAKTATGIVKAIAAKNPRPRYILATGGNILVFVMNQVFPTWLKDAFWKRFYGINKLEAEWQKAKLN
ncbi:MAG TPA: SDR family NAD(P)-dependent oxidoreductase [Xenococcaceae cyanobacterium]